MLPYAGPPCFLDPALFELNARLHGPGIFPDQHEALAWLRERLPHQRSDYLLPGDAVRLGGRWHPARPVLVVVRLDDTVEERRRYLEAYAERRRAAIDAVWAANPAPAADSGLGEAFRAHLESLATLSSYFLARIGLLVRFRVLGPAGGTWDAHLGPDAVRVDLDGGHGPADYEITVDARWLAGVVSGRTRWEELLALAADLGAAGAGHLQRLPRGPAEARRPGGTACGRGVRGGPRPRGHVPARARRQDAGGGALLPPQR